MSILEKMVMSNINQVNGAKEKDPTQYIAKDDIKDDSSLGLRFNKGKLKWSLVEFDSLEDMVRVLEFGAEKYDAHNWKKGLKTTEIIDSLLRHVYSLLQGEDVDKESNLPHTGHILCNAMFLSYMLKHKKELDDRYKDL